MRSDPAVARERANPWLVLVVGYLVLGVGIALLLHANVGVASWEVVTDALIGFGLSPGLAVAGSFAVAILLGLTMGVRPRSSTLLGMLLPALVVEVVLRTLPSTWTGSYVTLVVGAVVLGVGVGTYLHAGLGAAPGDLPFVGLLRRGFGRTTGKVTVDASVTVLGWIAGGTVALGTIVIVAIVGPAVACTARLLQAWTDRHHPATAVSVVPPTV